MSERKDLRLNPWGTIYHVATLQEDGRHSLGSAMELDDALNAYAAQVRLYGQQRVSIMADIAVQVDIAAQLHPAIYPEEKE